MNQLEANPEFEALLDYLKHNRGLDLTGYKRSTLMRRFRHRMQNIKIDNYQGYLQYLESHSEEWLSLLDEVLINVTTFFRDRDAWEYLATEIIPRIIASKQPDEPIRVWSAGCAAGQEVYSLMMLFAEALSIESCLQRVRFYATDADEAALEQARQATYNATEIIGIPPDLLEKYFKQTEKGYVFHPKLRRTIIFGIHNLVKDAPMSKIDLLLCRNVLIYFNPEAQASILVRFHFSLKKTGFLFLGKAETLSNPRSIFMPVNFKHHVYGKGVDLGLDDHLSINPKSRKKQASDPLISQQQFWETAFETSPFAQLAVDLKGYSIAANEQANILFGLTIDDFRRPFKELEPGKLVSIFTLIRKFYRDPRSVTLNNIEWTTSKGARYLDISIVPVFSPKTKLLGVILTFIDTTDRKQLGERLEETSSELATVSEALKETQAALNTAHIKLESTLKELETLHQDRQYIDGEMYR